jgi:hypothetical protein
MWIFIIWLILLSRTVGQMVLEKNAAATKSGGEQGGTARHEQGRSVVVRSRK